VSRTVRTRPTRAAAIAGAIIGAVVLAGCSAGQVTQTSDQVAAVGGANATVGAIAVRNAQFEFDTAAKGDAVYPRGGNAPLEMTIVNTGAEPDRLVAASSPAASSVQLSGTLEIPGGQVLVVKGAQAEAVAPTSTAVPTPGATPVPGAAPTTQPAATPTPTAEPGAPRQARIVLTGLREDIIPGLTYPVTLSFERAGDVRLDVPVGNPSTSREDEHAG
jgi:copper(I)-binding protein